MSLPPRDPYPRIRGKGSGKRSVHGKPVSPNNGLCHVYRVLGLLLGASTTREWLWKCPWHVHFGNRIKNKKRTNAVKVPSNGRWIHPCRRSAPVHTRDEKRATTINVLSPPPHSSSYLFARRPKRNEIDRLLDRRDVFSYSRWQDSPFLPSSDGYHSSGTRTGKEAGDWSTR